MLPASDLTEILTNLAGLKLDSNITAAVLGAVLAPLLRSDANPAPEIRKQRAGRGGRKPRPQRKQEKHHPMQGARGSLDGPRARAIAALKSNPDASASAIAKLSGVSAGTVKLAKRQLEGEARNAARREARRQSNEKSKATMPERRQRAEQFLRAALAGGPQVASDIEERAAKAHVDEHALNQARAELGVVTSRGNAGGVQAVTWSLPG